MDVPGAMLTTLAISGYRSLRNLVVPLGRLNLITGANGSGKSNLYRALRLLADTAQGDVVQSLALEGGLPSTLWAGPEQIAASVKRGDHAIEGTTRKHPTSLKLGFGGDDFGYLIDLGLPTPGKSMFSLDPEVKRECIWHGPQLRPSALLVDRHGAVVRFRGEGRDLEIVTHNLAKHDSVITSLADPRNAPEILTLRDAIRGWRFYDHFRADAEAPARIPQVGTRTTVLDNDGRDLAAALQTIREIGDGEEALAAAIDDAFPRSRVWIENIAGRFSVRMEQHGLLRPLDVAELSDGTLRYLLWTAVLLTPRPPELMVLNEPETSLHPDLLPALARLIARAAEKSQVIAVSHAPLLIEELSKQPGCHAIRLAKEFGETVVVGADRLSAPSWHWPSR
jgi:predicted ATPase